MFVASYARLPSITVRDTTSVPLHYGSGPLLQCAVPPRYRSGPLLQCAVPPRYRFGPLGPSITMRGTDTPFGFYKVLIGSE